MNIVKALSPHSNCITGPYITESKQRFSILALQNGLDILEAIRGRHPNQAPLVDKIIDRLASHVLQYGDGTKRIVFMLYHFWRAIANQGGREGQRITGTSSEIKWRLEILAQVRRFQRYTDTSVRSVCPRENCVGTFLSKLDLSETICP